MSKDTGFSFISDHPVYNSPMAYVSTGNAVLNWAISGKFGGGWPIGRSVELYGDPSTGKSLMAVEAMARVQKDGGVASLVDVEWALDKEFAKRAGLDIDTLQISNDDTVEKCFDHIVSNIELLHSQSKKRKLIYVIDSLAMLSTKHEKTKGFETQDMTKAKLVRQAMRAVTPLAATSNCLLIILNQTSEKIGMFVHGKTTPGGGGVKFGASVRVELFPAVKLAGTPPKGVLVKYKITKNKVSTPFRTGAFKLLFNSGIVYWSGVTELLVDAGAAEPLGGAKKFPLKGIVLKDKSYKTSEVEKDWPQIAKDLGFKNGHTALEELINEDAS